MSISLEDLRNDAATPDVETESDVGEIIDRTYVEKEEKKEEKPKAKVEFRKMNIGNDPSPVDRSQFKSEKKEVDKESLKLLDDLDFAESRIKERVTKAAEETEAEFNRQLEEGLKSGLIVKASKDDNYNASDTNINDTSDNEEEDDIYADDEADDIEDINENKAITAHDIIKKNEEEVIAMEKEAEKITDEDFENMMKDASSILGKEVDSTGEVVEEPEVEEDETKSIESPSQNDLPLHNPAVIFDEEDDVYDDDEDDEDEENIDEVSDENEEEEEEKNRKAAEEFRKEVKEKIKPVRNLIDLSKFSVRKKPVKASSIIKMQKASVNISDWVLPTLGRSISVSELSGMEIVKMNPQESGRNRIDTIRTMYGIIYNHIEDPNKGTYEEWCQTIPFADVNHLQFALYKATFEHSNFIHCSCENCNKISLQKIPLMDMVKFDSDEAKERFDKMYVKESVSPLDGYEMTLVQISDKYVFGLKLPSIYNVIVEIASLDADFMAKYSDLVDIVSFIDTIYYINTETAELIPISTNPVKGNNQKSCMRKIRIFNDILNNLSSDEYLTLRTKISELNNISSDISYKIPSTTCPSCGEEIDGEDNVDADRLLFTRHQLGLISNS